MWIDDIQNGASPWGFSGLAIERPIGNPVHPGDANGVNLSRVADPVGGAGFALRHFATFDAGGSRAQAGIWSFANPAFDQQVKKPEGVWVAQEWYIPDTISAGGDEWPWLNLWDWHSTEEGGANRWDTSPGLMLAEDGSMRVRWEWGGPANAINPTSEWSKLALPVGKWFDIEMHYTWTVDTTTLSLWIDGELALRQSGVQTRSASHTNVEMYCKFYGSDQGRTPWAPTPSIRYTRNVRIADGRIGVITSVNRSAQQVQSYSLEPNYPNPFNPETVIRFQLPVAGEIELVIFDVTGRRVRTLVQGKRNAGTHTVVWDGRDARGQAVASGIYLYRLVAGDHVQVRRMVVVR